MNEKYEIKFICRNKLRHNKDIICNNYRICKYLNRALDKVWKEIIF